MNNKLLEKRMDVQWKKQISREIEEEKDNGVSGKELSRKVYHIINKPRSSAAGRKQYIKPRPEDKKRIRTYLIVLRLKHNVQLLTELPVQSLLNIMTLSLKRKKDASQEVGLR
ncbi:hypothetical protein [Brevibacillus borstelensis]|uniref:hypothetical protein n=1 Tax=Brevibacillus borstelensis TaxID=45462 RepID=UPI00203DF368|nr:hypothetical protein [Brevibacillus borstelensis]MCM3472184.1 hypothetical protein [Brevibacillus borstelensis]